MSLKETINQEIKRAMLAREKDQLKALRSIKALILLAETQKGQEGELTPEKEISLLNKASKQRKESAEIFAAQNRPDLAEQELAELAVITQYLPAMMTPEEVERRMEGIIKSTGASGASDLGQVMGIAMKEMTGKADGKLINEMAKKLLKD